MDNESKTVLVVDDETIIRRSLSSLLIMEGYDVAEGRDGSEVAALAAEHTPDLVVMDIRMNEMDGFQALEELREDYRTEAIPVMMLSSLNDYEMGANMDAEKAGERAGVRAPEYFMDKPYDTQALLDKVEELTR